MFDGVGVGLRAAHLASTEDFLPSAPTAGAEAEAAVARATCRRRLVSSSSAPSFSLVTSRLVLLTRSFSADSISCREVEISRVRGGALTTRRVHKRPIKEDSFFLFLLIISNYLVITHEGENVSVLSR